MSKNGVCLRGCGLGGGKGTGGVVAGDVDKGVAYGHVTSDESLDLFMRGCLGVAVLAFLLH